MPITELTHGVTIELEGLVDLADIEDAALDFARRAPAELVASTVEVLAGELLDTVAGPLGQPLCRHDQPEAPRSCTACSSARGFRRRGRRPGGRKINSAAGQVHFGLAQLECLRYGRRFAPMLQVLGLRAHQRRTDRLGDLAASLAVEVAYAKAARLLPELARVISAPAPSAATYSPWPPSASDPRSRRCPSCCWTGPGCGRGRPSWAWACTWPSAWRPAVERRAMLAATRSAVACGRDPCAIGKLLGGQR